VAHPGTQIKNLISYIEVYSSLNEKYLQIDYMFIDSISHGTGPII